MFRAFFPLLLLLTTTLMAQNVVVKNDIIVRNGTDTLEHAWVGGLHNAQFAAIDLDGKGAIDLLVFDRSGNVVMPFVNNGGNGINYAYVPDWIDSIPSGLHGWVRSFDFDKDGYEDIFTGVTNSRVRVFRSKLGDTGKLEFELYDSIVETQYPPFLQLYSSQADIPDFIDVDNDGDDDFLTFDVIGSGIEYHKNITLDSNWNNDSTRFVAQSFCFGHFHESSLTCTPILNDSPCGVGMKTPPPHAGSTITALDLNGDELKDLLIGDIGCNTIYALRNAGTLSIAHFDSVENNFPSLDVPIDIPIFPATFYIDLDNDGVKDLVAAPNLQGTQTDNTTGTWFYKNTGSNSVPSFQFQKSGFFQDEMIEAGSNSAAAFFDYDGDGLKEFMVGDLGVFDTASLQNDIRFQLFRNVGSTQWPEFELIDDDFMNLAADTNLNGAEYLTPTFGDLDMDGDHDLLFGNVDGTIFYYENTAGAGNPSTFSFGAKNYMGIDVGAMSAPTLYDLDKDNDLDLIIGNKQGYLHYFENTGSVSSPNFVLSNDTLGEVKVNMDGGTVFSDGHTKPIFADWDNDGNVNLIVGTVNGRVLIYDNISASPSQVFLKIDSLARHDFGTMTSIAAGQIDSTGEWTYLVGGLRGGLQLVGTPPASSPIAIDEDVDNQGFQLFPNPSHGEIHLKLDAVSQITEKTDFTILTYNGGIVKRGDINKRLTTVDLSDLSAGIYIVRIRNDRSTWSRKFILTD